jgi:hypothetical protein
MTTRTLTRFVLAALTTIIPALAAGADTINVPADYATIQAAIIASADGDEVVVAPGVYLEAINFIGRAITVRSQDPADPNVVNTTIIDGNGADRVVQCVTGEGPDTVLAGLTITGGYGGAGDAAYEGAGMYNYGTSPTVRDCVFRDNYAYISGGGMFNRNGAPLVERCQFIDNDAGSGGGMWNYNASTTVRGCVFSGNDSFEDVGGGLFNVNGSTTFESCRFIGNTASNEGGAGNQGGSAVYTDCEFIGNHSDGCGGGMSNFFGAVVTLVRCTFTGNSASTCADAIRNYQATPTLVDCVICSNGDDQIDGAYTDGGGNFVSEGCPLPQAEGACCLGGACVPLTDPDCIAIGGVYQGDYVNCTQVSCPIPATPCPGDITGPGEQTDGMVGIEDFLEVLARWGACP